MLVLHTTTGRHASGSMTQSAWQVREGDGRVRSLTQYGCSAGWIESIGKGSVISWSGKLLESARLIGRKGRDGIDEAEMI